MPAWNGRYAGGCFGDRFFQRQAAAAPVTVASVAPAIGDTLGGGSVVITGTGFTGKIAADVLFGATAAASIVVDSDTQITAVSPARTAGVVAVSVSGVSLAAAFEFWSPAELSGVTGFWMQGNYANPGTGTWTSRIGANFVGSAGTSPTATNSEPVCAGTAGQGLTAGNASNFLAQGSYTVVIGFYATAAVTFTNTVYNTSPAFLSITGGSSNWGVHYDSRGFVAYHYAGVEKECTVTAALNTWKVGTARFRAAAGLLEARVGSGAFSSVVSPTSINSITGGTFIGLTTHSGGQRFTGTARFMIVANDELSDASCDKILAWAQARWPVFA